MDDLLPKLLSFPPHPPPKVPLSDASYDEGIKAQIATVGKISEGKLLQQTSGGENALDVINPALNTVPYVYILLAHMNAVNKNSKFMDLEVLYDKMTNFLVSFDGRQIRYLGKELAQVIEWVAGIGRNNRQGGHAISPIVEAVLRLDPSGSILTSNHLLLVKLALESRVYGPILPVLDKFILYFPGVTNQPKPQYLSSMELPPMAYITPTFNHTSKFKYQDVLEYFIYSGMIYIGLRRWQDALDCLENAVTYPVKDGPPSKIMVEAYKKWVLVSLLLDGKPRSVPKSTSGSAAKAYHVLAKPYEALASIFETASATRLKAEVEAGSRIWNDDCNTGLMLNVLGEYQKFQIRNLGNVYSKISIPEVLQLTMSADTGAKSSSPAVVENLVQGMINDGTLHATMSHPPTGPAVLSFSPKGPVLSEAQMQRELVASTERIQTLSYEIKTTDRMLTHDKEYIKYAQKQKKNAKTQADQGIAVTDMDWNAEDEELMAGVF